MIEFGGFVLAVWIKLAYAARMLACCGDFPRNAYPISATGAIVLLAAAAIVRLPPARRLAWWLVFDALVTLLAIADTMYFRFFGDVLSVYEVTAAWQLPGVRSSVRASALTAVRPNDLFFFADVAAGLVVLAYLMRSPKKPAAMLPLARRSVQVSLFGVALLLAIPSLRTVVSDPDDVFEYTVGRRQVVAAVGLLGYHLDDAAAYIVRRIQDRRAIGEAQRQRVREFLDTVRAPHESELFGVARGRNLLVVQVESLQAFALGLNVEGQPITPRLTELAADSVNFVEFFDQTYGGSTSDAIFTAMQSLHPLPVGAVATRYPSFGYHALPAVLGASGYRTLAAVGARGEFWNLRLMFPALGFHTSLFEDDLKPGERFGQGLADDEFFRQMAQQLAGLPKPFMSLLVSVSSHHPYRDLPDHDRTLRLGALDGTQAGDYLQLIHYVDASLGALLDSLRETGLLDDSVLVVYGDHQGFLDDTQALAGIGRMRTDNAFGRWRMRFRLPLMIRLPRAQHAGDRMIPSGHLDIAPTLLSLLGIVDAESVMLGDDLTRNHEHLVAFRNGGFAKGGDYFLTNAANAAEICYTAAGATPRHCSELTAERRAAIDRLEVSDLIVRGALRP